MEENRLLDSLKSEKIIGGDLEALNSALRYCIVKVGIRENNLPGSLEFGILVDHLIQNYGSHTAAEIRLAFDLAISGILDVEANSFESFSCLYVSTILNAYRKWKAPIIASIDREPPVYESKQISFKPHWGEQVEYYYQQLKAGKYVPYIAYPVQIYDQMCEDGFIQHNPLFTEGQKKEAVFNRFNTDKEWREAYYVPDNS